MVSAWKYENMKISVRVITRAKRPSVEKIGDSYRVRVLAAPVENRANQEVIALMAKYFGAAKSNVRILCGTTGRVKLVEILGH
ncbi:MAG: DUF167 domain-containing protein [Candidatus Sungbacteria bacterium]|nr:DUF167 domain-containing protein [Candidatus Sungbacteria bacterium]